MFQSTPLPTGRSDICQPFVLRDQTGFNPRPSQPELATIRVTDQLAGIGVSIHAPPNRKERPITSSRKSSKARFQSTSLPTGRSDTDTIPADIDKVKFQSTPLPTGRSDREPMRPSQTVLAVSIHAPPNRKERRTDHDAKRKIHGFNPRPSQPEGATGRGFAPWLTKEFQSTPLPTGRSDRYVP